MRQLKIATAFVIVLLSAVNARAQNPPILNMGFSGVGVGSDLLTVIERSGLWRKHGIDVRTIYLSSGTTMAQTLSSGDIGVAGFDTPAMLNLALAGNSLKVVAVLIDRLEPFFVVRNSIKSPADLKGKKIAISRFGSGSDIMTRVALKYWKIDPETDVSFFQAGNTPTRMAALVAGHMDAALVSPTGVAKIVATGCCRALADLSELPLEFANYGVVVSGPLLRNQHDNVKRFLEAIIEGIHTFKTNAELARAVLGESNGKADVGQLYERLQKSFRDLPTPEPRGIQNVLDSLPTPKARGAKAEDFIDTSLIDEIRKSGFMDKLAGK